MLALPFIRMLFFIVVCYSNLGYSSDIITALHRHGRLGFLYRGRTGDIVHQSVLKGKLPNSCLWNTTFLKTEYSSSLLRSSHDAVRSLQISGEAKLGILAGLVEVNADGGFAEFDESKINKAQGFVQITVTTLEKGFFLDCEALIENYVDNEDIPSGFSHAVTGMSSGYRFTIAFESTTTDILHKRVHEGNLQLDINAIVNLLSVGASVEAVRTNHSQTSQFSASVTGDVQPPSHVLRSFNDIITYVRQSLTDLRDKITAPRPLKYWITPLIDMQPGFSTPSRESLVLHVDEIESKKCMNLFKEFSQSYKRLLEVNHLNNLGASCQSKDAIDFFHDFFKRFKDSKYQFQYKFKAHFVEVQTKNINLNCSNIIEHNMHPNEVDEFLEREFKTYMDLHYTIRRFQTLNIRCLENNLHLFEYNLMFFNTTLVILSFKQSELDLHMSDWTRLLDEFLSFCSRGYSVACVVVNCDNSQNTRCRNHSIWGVPAFSVISDGQILTFKNISLFQGVKLIRPLSGPKYITTKTCESIYESTYSNAWHSYVYGLKHKLKKHGSYNKQLIMPDIQYFLDIFFRRLQNYYFSYDKPEQFELQFK